MAKLRYVCRTCGSDEVGHDAWVQWDFDSQKWEISNLMSESFCFKCEGETILDVVTDPQKEENDDA